MLAYDVIKNCDITRVISIYLDGWSDEDELENREETIAKLYAFWRVVCELTPNPSPDKILITMEFYDTYRGTYVASPLYKRDNLEEHLPILQSKEFPVYSADNSAEELRNIYFASLEDWYLETYDYEVLLWKDVVGFPILKEGIERHGADAAVASLFYEMMPFHGWRKKIQRTEGIEEEIAGIVRKLIDGNMDDVVDEDIEEPEEEIEDGMKSTFLQRHSRTKESIWYL